MALASNSGRLALVRCIDTSLCAHISLGFQCNVSERHEAVKSPDDVL